MSRNPHDALFKHTFSQVEHVAGEVRSVLAPALVAKLDFATLDACPGTFVDEALADAHADLLFSIELAGHQALLYLLLEHQSTVDPLMPFRMTRYMVKIWDGWLADHPGAQRLPVIVPIVVHHSETGWSGSVALDGILDIPDDARQALDPYLPRVGFVLDDLTSQTDEQLQSRAMSALGRAVLWCLRDARRPGEILRKLERWAEVVREVARTPSGPRALHAVFRYIWEVSDLRLDELKESVLAKVGNEVRDTMITTADRLRAEGRAEGQAEGRAEGERVLLLRLLTARFGSLPSSVVERVTRAAVAEVETWGERTLTAATLADVFGDA